MRLSTSINDKIHWFFLLIILSNINSILGQELNCNVFVNADQIQNSDRGTFKNMETSFSEFINTRKWTDERFEMNEKIEFNINITLKKQVSIGIFEGSVQIISLRPIFNSNYSSILFNFADRDWEIEYVNSQPLNYNDNTFTSNLTSLLAYYSYIILGLDYDSFSELGGTEYYKKALNVVNNAQQSNRLGWNSLGSSRNRYWLAENLNNQQMIELRKGFYTYHRLALDTFIEDGDNSRNLIVDVLTTLKTLKNTFPNSILPIAFLDAKRDELINIFSSGNIQKRREAYDILVAVDPSKSNEYKKIIE